MQLYETKAQQTNIHLTSVDVSPIYQRPEDVGSKGKHPAKNIQQRNKNLLTSFFFRLFKTFG